MDTQNYPSNGVPPSSSSSSPGGGAGAGKSVEAVSGGVGQGSVTKRLQSELMGLMMSDAEGISAFPVSDANLLEWAGTITGVSGTVYESLTFKISLRFPPNYPFSAPTVRFESTCYHPNVDLHGNICLDILKDKWSAVYNVQTILLSLQSMLGDPNNDSPLNGEAANLWEDQAAFKKQLMKYYTPVDDL